MQLSLKIDNRDFREQLPDEIVLRQQGRHLLGGSPDATDNSDYGGSNFDGSIEEVCYMYTSYMYINVSAMTYSCCRFAVNTSPVNHQHCECVPFRRQALLRCGDDTNKDVDMTGWYIARPRPGFVDGENVVITDATPTPTSGPSGVQFHTEKSFLRHPRCVNLRTCMTYVYVHMRYINDVTLKQIRPLSANS